MNKYERVESLDLLRGLVMVIMALDHVRDFVHQGAFLYDPTNMETTNPALFFTRLITHFCAPIFVFLAGTSVYLYQQKVNSRALTQKFLLSRGIWLIFVELTIVSFIWSFNPDLNFFNFQVIWAIGLSFIILAGLLYLPFNVILGISLLVIFSHNLLDPMAVEKGKLSNALWYTLHQQDFVIDNGIVFNFLYPIIPWFAVMSAGYCLGKLFTQEFSTVKRQQYLFNLSLLLLTMYIVIRGINIYGDPSRWAVQKNSLFTVMSFLNITKYPPSLLFLLLTIGCGLLFLSRVEHIKNKFTDILITFGRVPFFYYLLHLLAAKIAGHLVGLYQGRNWTDLVWSMEMFNSDIPATHGVSLTATYGIWALIVVLLYYPCKYFMLYKKQHPEKNWLKYF